MLEVHRCRQIEWSPSAVVALATSANGAAVAVARENGAIEIWSVAAGSLGWHCQLTIPGRQGAAISSLVWCHSLEEDASPLGRLFSSGLDGLVTEWDLLTLQPKAVVESMGGSIWQLAAEHMDAVVPKDLNGSPSNRIQGSEDSDSEDEGSSSGNDSDDEPERRAQRVALACEDGVVRIFEVGTAQYGLVYQKSFPRVKGRILSVAWSWDGGRLVAGGSDGCIRCWDITNTREIYRITAGIGGKGKSSDLCIWSLLVLRNGDIVSGDSSGSTQFWDGQLGTLLQAQTRHGADVLALAASGDNVFAAGADGKVVQFQNVAESKRLDPDAIDIARSSGEKWVYVGSKRTHTHDVRALAIATPIVAPVTPAGKSGVKLSRQEKQKARAKRTKFKSRRGPNDHRKWARQQTAMLISGGNDAKLFTYPANGFLSFHPHDVCPSPERPFIQLAKQSALDGGTLLMAQHSNRVDIWKIHSNGSTTSQSGNGSNSVNGHSVLGKRKWGGDSDDDSLEPNSNGHSIGGSGSNAIVIHSNGHVPTQNGQGKMHVERPGKRMGKSPGTPPALLATIKINSSEHIVCSAISGDGHLVAFADSQRPRLYELEPKMASMGGERGSFHIRRKKLPAVVQAAHCMVFSADSSRLLVAGPQGLIWVVDSRSSEVIHTFHVSSHNNLGWTDGIVKVMCTSSDGQWLAAASSTGQIAVFNLEVLRHQWTVPVLDGTPATAMVFHPGSNNVLIVSSAANQIHALDVEVKAPGEWSKRNGARIAKKMQDFPGSIIGLSLPSTPTSTSIIAYSSSAMCHIDFSQPIGDEVEGTEEDSAGGKVVGNGKLHVGANGNGNGNGVDLKVSSRSSRARESKSLVVVNMKDLVLFLGHTGPNSVLIVEKPWLEVLRQFPAPVARHVYGS
ncbi:hypothetical protein KC19_11G171000 [Ceratodon purpureus]|uniref:Uncharacterized protein n=2 Tax=Ceratodon purpureus TaxID=3225 RepID=A0A8T0GG50_CERPU|nr:hypothetical protein KC19_11G171000 [Ceratodon purpureus]